MQFFRKLQRVFQPIYKNRLFIGIIMLVFVAAIAVYGVIRALALDESTWRVGDGEATQLITGSGENVVITASGVTLDKDFLWPGLDWNHKRSIEIKNISANTLPLGDTVKISVNTSALEDVQDSCNDLRIGYVVEGKLVEIPREISLGSGSTTCNNSTDTLVTFKLQKELLHGGAVGYIQGDEYDSNYMIFYGNPGVGNTAPTYTFDRYITSTALNQNVTLGGNVVSGLSEFTLSFWGDYTTITDGQIMGLPFLRQYTNGTLLAFLRHAPTCGYIGGQSVEASSNAGFIITGRHHYAISIDSVGNVSFIRDGVVFREALFSNWGTFSQRMCEGTSYANVFGNGAAFENLTVWDRKLTTDEVMTSMNDSRLIADGLLHFYPFDEKSTTQILDVKGGFTGQLAASTPPQRKETISSVYKVDEINPSLICQFVGSTTCANNVTPVSTGSIRYSSGGNALIFDGNNDYIRLTNLTLEELTFSAWVKSEYRGGDNAKIQNIAGGTGIFDYLSMLNGRVRIYDGVNWRESSAVAAIPDGQWGHVAVTFRGSDKQLKIYVNGELGYSGTNISTYTNGTLMTLGKYAGADLRYFMGSMDHIRLDNTVLSNTEIAALYNNGNPQASNPNDSTVLLYNLDENGLDSRLSTIKTSLQTALGATGEFIAYDASGAGHNGLVIGAKYTDDTPIGDSAVMSHQGVIAEGGATNKILNPSFENAVYDKYWNKGYENVNFGSSTFVPKMAKRNTVGPFNAGVTVQGNDVLTIPSGNQLSGNFYQTMDHNQGTIAFWITPSWNGNDGQIHTIYSGNGISISKWSDNNIYVRAGSTSVYLGAVLVNTWTAGTTYNVIVSWDTKVTINGTHYVRVSINGVNSYIRTTAIPALTSSNYQVGADSIIEGLTVYRRVLFDGTYGVNVGNGNEISQIYNSGTGKDPSEITGSWDIVFALPTDGSVGELTSTNQAWSMPHSTNLLGVGGFLTNNNYGTDGFTKISNNRLSNSTFDNNLDNWNWEQLYLLKDDFNDTLPATLASGGISNPTPVLGSELVANGNMETGNPPSSWIQAGSATLTGSADERTGGSGAQSLDVVSTGTGGDNSARQSVTSPAVGTWYQLTGWTKRVSGSYAGIQYYDSVGGDSLLTTSPTWTTSRVISRIKGTNGYVYCFPYLGGTGEAKCDDISFKPFTLSSLFSSVSVSAYTDYTVQSNVTLTSGTQAGVVVSLDSDTNPKYFVIAYHDGTNAKLEKNVNGTYTTLVNVATTYVAGAPIKVVKNGTNYTLFYNNVLVGTTQTVSDAGIISNTRHGVFSTLASNSFSSFTVKGGVNGTLASDGVNMRTVVDTEDKISISAGALQFSGPKTAADYGNPGVWYPSLVRTPGRVVFGKVLQTQSGLFTLGFDNDASSTALHGLLLQGTSLKHASGGGVALGNSVLGQQYNVAVVMKATGDYIYLQGGSLYPNWTLIHIDPVNNVTPLRPTLNGYSGQTSVMNISVPDTLFLPSPIAYDTFTRANGTIGNTETTGPDGQTSPQLSWTGGSISSNAVITTPAVGSDLVTNGNFDTDTTGWLTNNGGIVQSVAGGQSGNALQLTDSSGTDGATYQRITVEAGSYYQLSFYVKTTTGSGGYALSGPAVGNEQYIQQSYLYAGTTWTQKVYTFRATTTDAYIYFHGLTASGSILFDSMTLKKLIFTDLFSTVPTTISDVVTDINVTLPLGLQTVHKSGLVVNLDSTTSPANFVIAYHDGKNVKLEKCVGGVYTSVQTTAVTYVAGAQLRVIKEGTKYRVYYNNALIGAEQTIADAGIINNTRHGVFSTYEANTFDNFSIFARGTNGEYNNIPAEDLTAYRDTSRSYNGIASVKLISGGNNSNFTQTETLETGNTYTLSTYVYKDGSAVSSSDVTLFYDNAPITTTFESVGLGWYKLTGSISGINSAKEVGVTVKATRSLNVDEITLKVSESNLLVENTVTANKVFNSGYKITSDTLSGVYKEIDITTGQDIVIRGVAHSDGVSIPKLSVYDVTNDIEIGSLTGTNASTKNSPNNLIYAAEGTIATKATGTITLTTNPINGELLEIGGVIYEFKDNIASPLTGEIYVKIGTDSTVTASNMVLAIMGGSGAGTNYEFGTGAIAHASVNATSSTNIISLETKATGKSGNVITLSEVGNSTTLSSQSLTGGRDNSTKLSIRLLNNSSTSSDIYWHQVEVYNNMINNGSFDRGYSTVTGVAGNWAVYNGPLTFSEEKSIAKSGSSQKWIGSTMGGVTSSGGGVVYQPGTFYYRSLSAYTDQITTVGFQSNSSGLGAKSITTVANQWNVLKNVKSSLTASGDNIYINRNAGSSSTAYIDDALTIALAAVPLTVTPSNLTDSQTNGGVTVNGKDTLTVPLNMSNPNNGVIRFDYTPIWSNPLVYGSSYQIFTSNTESRIALYNDGAYRFLINGTTVNISGLTLTPGQRYSIEVSYNAGATTYLKVDGTIVASTTAFNGFTTSGPTNLYLGSRYDGEFQADGTFYPYTSSTVSSNTSASFLKFGTKSINIVTGTTSDEYVTELNLGATYHQVSAYIYNNTTGSVGGTVDSNVAQLIFNNVPVATTYVDMGGGWWRLYYRSLGVASNQNFGVQVKANKNVYVDGFMANDLGDQYQTGLTKYVDGSLGSGYAWSGVANESTSIRTGGSLEFANVPINTSNNTVAFWLKLETPLSSVASGYIFSLGDYYMYRNPGANANNLGFNIGGSDIRYNPGFNNTNWYFITITDAPSSAPIFYINGIPYTTIVWQNGVQPPDAIYNSSSTLKFWATNSKISDFRIYSDTLSADQITRLYTQGMNTYTIGDNSNGKYADEGTWTSQVIDLGNNGQWGMSPALTITDNKGSDNIIYKTRTSPDNNTWTDYQTVVSADGAFNFASPPNRYLQIQALLQSTNKTTTPTFNAMEFNFVMDTIKPAVNASDIRYYSQQSGGQLQTPDDWTNIDSPYISWTAGVDNTDGSGLRGYCLYLGQNINADPANESGLLSDVSPIHTTDTDCKFIIDTNHIDLSDPQYKDETWMTSSNSPYYFKVKAVDYTGNVFGEDETDAEVYTFKLDNTRPNNPKGISAPQTFQREISSFRIFWADSGTSMATDAHSQVKGYQYRIGENGIWYGASHTGDQDCNDLITTSSYTLQEQFVGETFGDELNVGSNVFYLRTWDNICNVTEIYATAILQYSADAPSAPQNLVVDPIENDVNEFTFTWDEPEVFSGDIAGLSYCYTVNALPGATRCNWTPNRTLSADAYANQPGENILYLVAKDEAGNVNYADYTSITFSANTSAPGLIRNLEVSDVSIKSTQKWRLALSWDEPEEKGAGIKTYRIYRSEIENSNYALDPGSFEHIATIGGESFTDVNLDQKIYYYVARACDSANNCGAPSNTVSLLPTGRFFTPAKILVEPTVSSLSTRSATITWVTERESDSKIAYGVEPGEYFEEEVSNSDQVVEHTITLNNLVAGTTYYYSAKWTDEDGNTGMSDDLSFKTAPPPVVKDVELVHINLDSAGIKFTTKGSSKVKIYYGESSTLGQSAEMETSPVETTYTMMLTGLNDGKKYFYKINLFDIEDNEYDGTVLLNFETPPRPLLSNVRVQEKYGTAQPTLEITWESNTEVNSVVRFYPTGREDLAQNRVDINLKKGEHTMSINGLIPQTPYTIRVEGTDRYGNLATSENIPITTATDTRPPLIYDLQIESTILGRDIQPDRARSAQVIVSWKTDEPSTSQIQYDQGLGDAYGQSTSIETNGRVEHVIIIPNLSPSAVYHLRVSTVDVAENESKSEKMVVVTPKATNTVIEVVTESLENIFSFMR